MQSCFPTLLFFRKASFEYRPATLYDSRIYRAKLFSDSAQQLSNFVQRLAHPLVDHQLTKNLRHTTLKGKLQTDYDVAEGPAIYT